MTVDASVTQAPKQEQGQANSAATGSQSSGGTSLSSLLGLNKARITSAKVGAGAVRQAAELYVATSAEAGRCPQPQDLVAAKLLDPPSAADPWVTRSASCAKTATFGSTRTAVTASSG